MPKPTFLNLEERKRKRITYAFLREFAVRSYDEASLTVVVKQLGIAKGSVYQYFDDKLDLFLYLIGECARVKQDYIASIKREDYPDYWSYFRELFKRGCQFDAENPLQSHFLHNLTQNLNSPSIKNIFDEMMSQTVAAFEQMVEQEVQAGLFRPDVPVKTMGFLLYKIGVSIQEQLEVTGAINPAESIENNQSVYQGKKEILLQTVDEYIRLARGAFDRNEAPSAFGISPVGETS
ncbi:MAG: TetR/AcrR family transcriptional regulator [Saprospiraceae bacterium]|nr:TetR/AcrR family transcriptional regulator [Lewinella sp.]